MFLALVLSLGVVLVFSFLIDPGSAPEEPAEQPPAEEEVVDEPAADTDPEPEPVADTEPTPDTDPEPIPEDRAVVEVTSDTVPFETDVLKGYFTLEGARLQSIKTKDFPKLDDRDEPYDMVADPEGRGLFVELGYPEPVLRNREFQQLETDDPNRYVFETRLDNGLLIRKEYFFNPEEPYRASLDVRLHNPTGENLQLNRLNFPEDTGGDGSLALFWGPGFGMERAERGFLDMPYIYYWLDGGMSYLAPEGGGYGSMIPFMGGGDDENGSQVAGPLDWTAPSSRYFLVAAVPEQPFNQLVMERELYAEADQDFTSWSVYEPLQLIENETQRFSFDLYLGPRNYYRLQDFHSGMEDAMNYWFTFLSLPMLWVLHYIHAVIPNFGIAIIILCFLIKFMLYPLTKKGLVSMRKMRDLQPEMKKIQEEYSDDKEKQQEKMIEFYQEHNLNPVGSCLPMLLQIPFFIALYSILRYDIALRGAHFFLWIDDLSAMDPYYILPVLMGVLMFFQQRYTMSSGGGTTGQQQKMMMWIMPPMMTFLFLSFPVGLVLYFMCNSGVTMLQYWLIDQTTEDEGEDE